MIHEIVNTLYEDKKLQYYNQFYKFEYDYIFFFSI